MLAEDESDQKLRVLPKHRDFFSKYDDEIKDRTREYQKAMIQMNKNKRDTITYCVEVLRKAERESEQESIELVRQFRSDEKKIMKEANKMDEQDPELNDKEDELVAMVDQLEDALMGVEMKLVDLLSTATADFKGKVDNQINDMKKETISYIKEISNQDA